jgi:hypothetical protein
MNPLNNLQEISLMARFEATNKHHFSNRKISFAKEAPMVIRPFRHSLMP